jgi:hypothetical protein
LQLLWILGWVINGSIGGTGSLWVFDGADEGAFAVDTQLFLNLADFFGNGDGVCEMGFASCAGDGVDAFGEGGCGWSLACTLRLSDVLNQ